MTKPNIARRVLGRTGISVTELGFGAMNLRLLPSFEDARRIVGHVLDAGVNLIDTARAYKGDVNGVTLESERVVGEVIKARTDLTEPIVIVTKGHGYTPEAVREYYADSRAALGIEGAHDLRIGQNPIKLVYFLHGISTERWATISQSGVLDSIRQMKADGLVNAVGFSSHYPFPAEIKAAIDTGVFDVMELPYNIFNRSLGEDGAVDLLKYANERGMGVVNMKAFDGNGMQPAYPMLREFIDITHEDMLRFCLSNPYITTVDAGAKWPVEFDADISAALSPKMAPNERAALAAEADKVSGHLRSVCRGCTHCMEKFECPHGVDFVEPLGVYSRYLIADALGKDTSAMADAFGQLEPFECAECGACLPWCEYKLDIPAMLKAAKEVFA